MRYLLVALCCLLAPASYAATITYTETVTATGSLNNVAFTNALLTLVATADTTTVTQAGSIYSAPTLTFGGTVQNVGMFSFASGAVFSNEPNSIAGLTLGVQGDILDATNSAFATYVLQSAIGPLTGASLSSLQNYVTTTGSLSLTRIGSTATFQAVVNAPATAVTPEPSSFVLLGTGALGMVGMLRKRLA